MGTRQRVGLSASIRPGSITWGESAGGHLAVLAGLTGDRPELEGPSASTSAESSAVCGVIDWYGPMNLLSLGSQHPPDSDKRPDDADSWESTMVGVPLQTDPARTLAREPDLVRPRRRAPIQIHHGTADTLVPFAQSVEFAEALRACRRHGRAGRGRRQDHFWTGAPDLSAIFDSSLAFAHRVTA